MAPGGLSGASNWESHTPLLQKHASCAQEASTSSGSAKATAGPAKATPAAKKKRPGTTTATAVAAVVGDAAKHMGVLEIGEAVKKLVLESLTDSDLMEVAAKMTVQQHAAALAKKGYIASQHVVPVN